MNSECPERERSEVSISFRPNVKLVSCVRRFVSEFCNSTLADPDAASRIALTVHELLENTLKYSKDGRASVDLVVSQSSGQPVLKIRSRSRATAEQLVELRSRLDALKTLPNPMETYISMMTESAEHEQESGLGLIRIRVEGQMELTYSVNDDVITIHASTLFGKDPT